MESATSSNRKASLLRDLILATIFSPKVSAKGERGRKRGRNPPIQQFFCSCIRGKKGFQPVPGVGDQGQYFKIQAKKLQLTPFLLDYHPQSQHLHMFLHSCFLKLKPKACHYHKPHSVAMRWGLLDKLHPGRYILLLQRFRGRSNEFHARHVYCSPLVLVGI